MATKYGTAKGETITGTSSADTVYARAGDDTLLGRAGGDRLLGEAGNDKVYGEDGNDTLTGGFGDDLLDGGAGRDRILYTGISATGADGYGVVASLAEGYADTSTVGRDTLRGIEDVEGSRFYDFLGGNGGANMLSGGGGNDDLRGSGGADKLYGGSDEDVLIGDDDFNPAAGGADLLYGGDGRDWLYGYFGNDTLRGDSGDDYLLGDSGDDILVGGTGRDRYFHYSTSDHQDGKDVIADFVKGEDEVDFEVNLDGESVEGFRGLDTNGNGALDARDEYVDVASASHAGVSKTSTIIDLSAEAGGPARLVVFGVTGLTADDFSFN